MACTIVTDRRGLSVSGSIMFIDSHAHLDDSRFEDDVSDVISRAVEAGVSLIINPGSGLKASRRAVELAERFECIRAAAGIGPHDIDDHSFDDWRQLEKLAHRAPIVAIGEIGLEYHYYKDAEHRKRQQEAFRRQLDLADELDLPVIIHCREAHADLRRILSERVTVRKLSGVVHCFSGTEADAAAYIDLGLLVSFTGVITFKKAEGVRKIVSAIASDNLMIETDSPYMAPEGYRGKRCEPAHVIDVARKLAEIHALSLADIGRITSGNALRLFRLKGDDEKPAIVYPIRDSLYVNLTNRCTNRCVFCPRETEPRVKGHWLGLEHEPAADKVIDAIGDPSNYDEVVFCGFGEPTLRLETLKQVARAVRQQGSRVRVNTNGHGSMINGRDIAPELAGLVDTVSVSLNTADERQYVELCRPQRGVEAYRAMIVFIRRAIELLPGVSLTALDYPGVDVEACKRLAAELGAQFRCRKYRHLG